MSSRVTLECVVGERLEARVGLEPTNRGFADRPKISILLARHAFAPALLAGLGLCLGRYVPKLFPGYWDEPL
jgi:hypothetical protein